MPALVLRVSGRSTWGCLQQMQKYLEYSQVDLDLLRRCTHLHKRSLSRNAAKSARSKTITSDKKVDGLEDTRKIEKGVFQQARLDDMSTKKKKAELPKKNIIHQVSEFAILQQRSEQSSIFKSPNLKQKASQNHIRDLTPSKLQRQILERIDQLKNRLQYRLYVNNRELMKRPAYGRYITCKYTEVKE